MKPQRRIRYFDANGVEVNEQTATRHGILLSGYALRVPTTLRDAHFSDGARAFWDQHRGSLLVVDARRIGGVEGNKPGYRIFDNDLGRQAIADAHAAYRHDLENQWRNPPRDAAFGAYPYGAYPLSAGEGNQCTINGRSGRLVREGDVLVCKPIGGADAHTQTIVVRNSFDADAHDCPDCNGSGEIDGEDCERCDGTGELDDDDNGETSDRRVLDVNAISANHQQRMQRLYDAHARELSEAWKGNK